MNDLELAWYRLREKCNQVCDRWLNEWDRIDALMDAGEYEGEMESYEMDWQREYIVRLSDLPYHLFDVVEGSFDLTECDTIEDEIIALFEGEMDLLSNELSEEFWAFGKADIDMLLESVGNIGLIVDKEKECLTTRSE